MAELLELGTKAIFYAPTRSQLLPYSTQLLGDILTRAIFCPESYSGYVFVCFVHCSSFTLSQASKGIWSTSRDSHTTSHQPKGTTLQQIICGDRQFLCSWHLLHHLEAVFGKARPLKMWVQIPVWGWHLVKTEVSGYSVYLKTDS